MMLSTTALWTSKKKELGMMWMMQIYATLLATTIGTLSIRRRLVLQVGLLHDRLLWMIDG